MFFNTSKFLQPSLLLPHPYRYNSIFLFPFHLLVTSGFSLTILNGLTLSRCQLQCVTGNNQLVTITPAVQKEELCDCTVKLLVSFVVLLHVHHTSRSVTSFSNVSKFWRCDEASVLRTRDYVYAHMYINIYTHTYVINTTPFSRIRILEVPPKLPVVLVKRAIKTFQFRGSKQGSTGKTANSSI